MADYTVPADAQKFIDTERSKPEENLIVINLPVPDAEFTRMSQAEKDGIRAVVDQARKKPEGHSADNPLPTVMIDVSAAYAAGGDSHAVGSMLASLRVAVKGTLGSDPANLAIIGANDDVQRLLTLTRLMKMFDHVSAKTDIAAVKGEMQQRVRK